MIWPNIATIYSAHTCQQNLCFFFRPPWLWRASTDVDWSVSHSRRCCWLEMMLIRALFVWPEDRRTSCISISLARACFDVVNEHGLLFYLSFEICTFRVIPLRIFVLGWGESPNLKYKSTCFKFRHAVHNWDLWVFLIPMLMVRAPKSHFAHLQNSTWKEGEKFQDPAISALENIFHHFSSFPRVVLGGERKNRSDHDLARFALGRVGKCSYTST